MARWRLTDVGRSPSISPLIDHCGPDRRSHFWFQRTHVEWVKDYSHS
jgi:hypothetical protein